jgi:RNA polymerase sigma factor (sigma-70 family)
MQTLTMTLAPTAEQAAEATPAERSREHVAFGLLVRQHHRALLAYGRALNANAGADLVQEALLVAYRRLEHFDPQGDFAAWVRGIIRNKWRDYCRSLHEQPLDEDQLATIEAQHATWAHAVAEARERNPLFSKLEHCLAKLPDPLRQVVDSCYYQAHTSEEAATELGLSPVSIRKRLERARSALRDCLAQ